MNYKYFNITVFIALISFTMTACISKRGRALEILFITDSTIDMEAELLDVFKRVSQDSSMDISLLIHDSNEKLYRASSPKVNPVIYLLTIHYSSNPIKNHKYSIIIRSYSRKIDIEYQESAFNAFKMALDEKRMQYSVKRRAALFDAGR
jgi:hypothetical protein